jgi:hypothetical protein
MALPLALVVLVSIRRGRADTDSRWAIMLRLALSPHPTQSGCPPPRQAVTISGAPASTRKARPRI